jgi:hypothetical protein
MATVTHTWATGIRQKFTDFCAHVYIASAFPGGRNVASEQNSYTDVRTVGTPVLLTGTSAVAIGGSTAANDTHLIRIVIHTALAGTVTIAGFEDTAGAAQNFVLPASLAAGSYEFGHALNTKGQLTMQMSSATDNNRVMVITRQA